MPTKLTTKVERVLTLQNKENRKLLLEFHGYMKENEYPEPSQGNELLAMFYFADQLGNSSLLKVNKRQETLAFLDTKKEAKDIDPGHQ